MILAYTSNKSKEIKNYITMPCCWVMLFCFVLFLKRISLYNPDWPGICYTSLAALKYSALLLSLPPGVAGMYHHVKTEH